MIRLITVLSALMGWGLGEALGPVLYSDLPQAWFFLRAFGASALAWLTCVLVAVNNRQPQA
jgi:hypothetical protein